MTVFPLGELLSLTAGLCWAAAVVLYRKSRADESAVGFNFVKCVIACALFALTLLVTGTRFVPDVPAEAWVRLALTSSMVSALDVGKLTAGYAALGDVIKTPVAVFVVLERVKRESKFAVFHPTQSKHGQPRAELLEQAAQNNFLTLPDGLVENRVGYIFADPG